MRGVVISPTVGTGTSACGVEGTTRPAAAQHSNRTNLPTLCHLGVATPASPGDAVPHRVLANHEVEGFKLCNGRPSVVF